MPSSLARFGSSVVVCMALGLVLFERTRLSSHTALAPARPSSLPAVEPRPASLPPPPPPADEPPAVLPLPNCSVFFFHHLEKTGGTTLRSVMQRAAQLGELDFISFVNRFDKLQFQAVLHRLWTLLRTPGGLTGLRLGVEIHIGGHRDHAFFLKYTVGVGVGIGLGLGLGFGFGLGLAHPRHPLLSASQEAGDTCRGRRRHLGAISDFRRASRPHHSPPTRLRPPISPPIRPSGELWPGLCQGLSPGSRLHSRGPHV